ncbi:MAG: hypothetical protein LBN06_00575 [Prevotellaceae bacterium]|jgi:hypothetical protein|nr:hypothetical protein [Prevotellaceae bacterium]
MTGSAGDANKETLEMIRLLRIFAGGISDDRNIFPPLLLKNLKSLDDYSLLFTFAALFPVRSSTHFPE